MSPIRNTTRRGVLAGAAAVLGSRISAPSVLAGAAGKQEGLDGEFSRRGATGTFTLLDLGSDRLTLANAPRAGARLVPASTFKIANSLIALETGAVRDERETIPYGGKPQPFPQWEKDMTLGEAIKVSNVPVFQEVARRIGSKAYEVWLEKLDYGNGAVGSAVDRFWLDGPLKISATEQAGFLAALALSQLPMSQRSQGLVRDMLQLETRGTKHLYGKTGWLAATTPNIGWWVGWVSDAGKPTHTFALNIDMAGADDLPKRLDIGRSLLGRLGVYS